MAERDEVDNFIAAARDAGKKIVLINANCHGTALERFLRSSSRFTEQFEIYPLPPVQLNTEKRIDARILMETDIFIHQDIRADNSIAYELSDQVTVPLLKRSCVDLVIPNLVSFGKWLYPNLAEIISGDASGQRYSIFRDHILDGAVKEGDIDADLSHCIDIFNDYRYPGGMLDDLFGQRMARLKERQKRWDVDIYGFMTDHYKTIPMFVDAGHPSKYVMHEIGRQVLGLLDIKDNVPVDGYESALGIPAPAPPRIMEYFGIAYTVPVEPRKSFVFDRQEAKTGERYIYEYIAEYLYLVHGMRLS